MQKGAIISKCGNYRHDLWRTWDALKDYALWVMLNPSTANGADDDNTIRKCVKYSKSWGYGGIHVSNLFDFRLTDSKKLKSIENPFSQDCLKNTKKLALDSGLIICGWGNEGGLLKRSVYFNSYMTDFELYCLKINKNGQPAHPLYLKDNLQPIIYRSSNYE